MEDYGDRMETVELKQESIAQELIHKILNSQLINNSSNQFYSTQDRKGQYKFDL